MMRILSAFLFLLAAASAGWTQPAPAPYGPGSLGSNLSPGVVTATGGATARSLAARANDDGLNLKDGFGGVAGAKGTGRVKDVAVTVLVGTPNAFTISGMAFTQANVGDVISITEVGIGGKTLVTKIATVIDGTHITTVDPASTFSSGGQTVWVGPDDGPALTAVIQAYRATRGNGSSAASAAKIMWPAGIYMAYDSAIDLTQFKTLTVEADGVTVYGATGAGKAVIDMLGSYRFTVRGLNVVGASGARTPRSGLQFGQYSTVTGAMGLNTLAYVNVTGDFSLTPCYNVQSETTLWLKANCETLSVNNYGMVLDGFNFHTVTSDFVTVDLPLGSQSSSGNLFVGTRVIAKAAGSHGVWQGNAHGHTWLPTSYISTLGRAFHMYHVPGRQEDFEFQGALDGPPTTFMHIERPAGTNTAYNGRLKISIHDNRISGSIFATEAGAGVVKLYGLDLTINELYGSSTLFGADPNLFQVDGNIRLILPAARPTLPTAFTGRLDISESSSELINVKNGASTVTTVSGATSGTFTKASDATWVQFKLWGVGGAGGAGISCGVDASCSGGAGGGAGGETPPMTPVLWSLIGGGVTTCSYSIGSTTTVTCGTWTLTARSGGAGATGQAGAIAAGGGSAGAQGNGGAASGSTGGTAGTNGGLAGTQAGSADTSSVIFGTAGSGSSALGVGASGGNATLGPGGGAGGGGCNGGTVAAAGAGGGNMRGTGGAAGTGGGAGGAGKSGSGTSGTGGGGGHGSATTTAGVGGAGGTPGGGGGGGGDGCDGVGTGAAGGAGGAGQIVMIQG